MLSSGRPYRRAGPGDAYRSGRGRQLRAVRTAKTVVPSSGLALRASRAEDSASAWVARAGIGAAALGPVFFEEKLTLAQASWLGLIIAGVVWLKLTDRTRSSGAR